MRVRRVSALLLFSVVVLSSEGAQGKSYLLAYISDSANASPAYWVAKEKGIFKKHGLDIDLIYISGSTRGIQSLIAGDVAFVGAVGTSAVYGKLAGGDVAIVDSLTNTLPYYIIGKAEIKSPEDIRGPLRCHPYPRNGSGLRTPPGLKTIEAHLERYQRGDRRHRDGSSAGRYLRPTGFHRGTGGRKSERRAGRTQGNTRHGQEENPVSINLHRHFAKNDSGESRCGSPPGEGDGGDDSLL
jgi:hypothetical protein